MDLKGELKQGGLPSLFRNFATENFAGVLTITSTVGEKLITLTEGEVTIYSDELNESTRLGNILMAREKVSVEQIEQTLRDQRKIEPRPMLGDMLIQRGLVTQQDCADARRFQVEEDICDILSWKNARFHFAGRDSARVIRPEDFAADQVHRLAIDPESFFKSVTKLSEEWETIGKRLPTQYLCFKVSSKADEHMSRLTPKGQRILKHLGEGRTIEGMVKFTCYSRIEVCLLVIELLEKGMILPMSGADLRFQASEHRAHQRYHEALYIYRRILESPESKEEKEYLDNITAEVSQEIINQKTLGGYGDEAVILSHRDARVRFQRQRLVKTVLVALVMAGLLVGAVAFYIRRSQINAEEPERYQKTLVQVDEAMNAKDYNKAKSLLNQFYASLEDKESETGRAVSDKIMKLPAVIDAYVGGQLPDLEVGVKSATEEIRKAMAALQNLKDTYPGNKHIKKIDELIAHGEEKLRESNPVAQPVNKQPKELTRPELLAKLNEAYKLQGELKYAGAERLFQELARQAPASDSISKQADSGLTLIQDIKLRAKTEFEKYKTELAAKHGEAALAILTRMRMNYPDLELVGTVVAKEQELISRKKAAEEQFANAREEVKQGQIYQAIKSLVLLAGNYSEWPVAEEATKLVADLQSKVDAVRQDLEAALELVKNAKWSEARKIFAKLMDTNYQMLVDQKVQVPIYVNSIPAGSALRVNGEPAPGPTPQNVMVPVGKPIEIVIERAGFKPVRVAKTSIKSEDLEMKFPMNLAPVVVDLKAPLYAPAAAFEGKPLLTAGPTLMLLNPLGLEPIWTLSGLFNERDPIPEGAQVEPGEGKTFWHCRVSPQPFLAGKFLLPMRNRDVLEIDVATGPSKSVLLRSQPAEVVGKMYVEEKSRLAQQALLVAPFSDGRVRVYKDFEKHAPREFWSVPLDPEGNTREALAAGPHAYRRLIYLLSSKGRLSAQDIVENKEVWKQDFDVMSPRSVFSSVPDDNLAALVHRNGKVILFDLESKKTVWELPKRQAMQESVGALINSSGVFIVTANNDVGMLQMFDRKATEGGQAKELWSISLQGHVDFEMSLGKYLYLVTHLNRVFAFEISSGRQVWEYKLEPEMGKPLWIRAIGNYVFIGTATGKLMELRAE